MVSPLTDEWTRCQLRTRVASRASLRTQNMASTVRAVNDIIGAGDMELRIDLANASTRPTVCRSVSRRKQTTMTPTSS